MKDITPQTLRKWLDLGSAVLIDVREPDEYKAMHIPEAHLLPLSEFDADRFDPAWKDKKIVLQCRSGKRSCDAYEKLVAGRPDLDVYVLEGGIMTWYHGGQVVKMGPRPIWQQVQITLGTILIAAIVFGLLFGRGFYLIIPIVAFGMILSGFTGWCGLALLLQKMPWNKDS